MALISAAAGAQWLCETDRAHKSARPWALKFNMLGLATVQSPRKLDSRKLGGPHCFHDRVDDGSSARCKWRAPSAVSRMVSISAAAGAQWLCETDRAHKAFGLGR